MARISKELARDRVSRHKAAKKAAGACDKCTMPGVDAFSCPACGKKFFRCVWHRVPPEKVLTGHASIGCPLRDKTA